jgi:hypothetical protein
MNRRQRQEKLAKDALTAGRAISATGRAMDERGDVFSITVTIQKVGNLYYVDFEEYYPVGYIGKDIRKIKRTFVHMDEAVEYATRESQIKIWNFKP